jgi:hypothetical protein
MNQTVELVKLWGAFEEKYPDGSIEDFCRYYLISQREGQNPAFTLGGVIPKSIDGVLLKTIGRIARLNATYAYVALKGTGVDQLEEFGILLSVQQRQNPRKTEVIYSNIQELSGGTVMVNRLISKGLLAESADVEDKRSKRITLTPAGEKAIGQCKERIGKLAKMMLLDLDEEDKKLCIQLLKGVEVKYTALWDKKQRGKAFEDIFKEITQGSIT